MMLPNEFVYGYDALAKMAQENDIQIVCPGIKEIYPIAEVRGQTIWPSFSWAILANAP